MNNRAFAKLVLALAGCLATSPALAAPLDWDCDAPANRTSALSTVSGPRLAISATIVPMEFRQANAQSMGALQFLSTDGKSGIAVQFVITAPNDPNLLVRAISVVNGQQTSTQLGTVAIGKPDPRTVSFALTPDGNATLTVDGKAAQIKFPFLPSARAGIYCGSGRFIFKGVTLTP